MFGSWLIDWLADAIRFSDDTFAVEDLMLLMHCCRSLWVGNVSVDREVDDVNVSDRTCWLDDDVLFRGNVFDLSPNNDCDANVFRCCCCGESCCCCCWDFCFKCSVPCVDGLCNAPGGHSYFWRNEKKSESRKREERKQEQCYQLLAFSIHQWPETHLRRYHMQWMTHN